MTVYDSKAVQLTIGGVPFPVDSVELSEPKTAPVAASRFSTVTASFDLDPAEAQKILTFCEPAEPAKFNVTFPSIGIGGDWAQWVGVRLEDGSTAETFTLLDPERIRIRIGGRSELFGYDPKAVDMSKVRIVR